MTSITIKVADKMLWKDFFMEACYLLQHVIAKYLWVHFKVTDKYCSSPYIINFIIVIAEIKQFTSNKQYR